MLLALCFGGGNADGQIWLLVLAAAPLVIGLMFLKVARYITTGRLS